MKKEVDYLAIGQRIRSARLKKNMTQENLATIIDCATTYISSIENGHAKLSLSTIIEIAKALDTTLDILVYDNLPLLVSQYDADMKELLEDCTPTEQQILKEMLKSFKLILRNHRSEK